MTSTEMLYITTNITHNTIRTTTDSPVPRPRHVPVTITDLRIGGSILLTLSVIFTIVNGFLIWLALRKSWKTIKQSKFFTSFYLRLVLLVTDFLFALLVGFPASLHLTGMSYFRKQPTMRIYSFYIGHFFFVFIFNFRVLIIALMSLDSFFHIKFPFRYEAGYESKRKVQVALILAAAIPIVFKIVPGLFLLKENDSFMSCNQYKDPTVSAYEVFMNKSHFFVPLTCEISLPEGNHAIVKADMIASVTVTTVSWFVLAVTNAAVLFIAVRRMLEIPFLGQTGKSMKQVVRPAVITCLLVIFTFMLSNFPYVVIWLMSYLSNTGYGYSLSAYVTDRGQFYLTLITFLSLIFNPWFFVLRLRSFRELLKKFFSKKKVLGSLKLQNCTRTSIVLYPQSEVINLETANSDLSPVDQRQKTITNIAQVTKIDPR
ncbi:hypothetical protein ACHWQZ_G002466 [Mnemiopsis leidyi]